MSTRNVLAALMLALPACGGGKGTPTTPAQPLAPPVGSFVVSPAGVAVVGVTVMTFNATASDPAGSALTYTWDFGDGQRGFTGQSVTHVYSSAGSFPVVLTLRNAGGASATANGAVTARSLTGSWVDVDPHVHFELTQSAASLSGRRLGDAGFGYVREGALSGTLTDPRSVTFDLFLETSDCRYAGTVSADGNNVLVTRTLNGPFCAQNSYNITRQ